MKDYNYINYSSKEIDAITQVAYAMGYAGESPDVLEELIDDDKICIVIDEHDREFTQGSIDGQVILIEIV